MAGTAEVLSLVDPMPNTDLSVLVPNGKGLDEVLRILSASVSPDSAAKPPPPVTEVAIFTSATDAFSRANTNVTVSESLARLEPVARAARTKGLQVRGYVSVVVTCPYSGRVDPRRVRDISRELLQMGCYEVSLGDTTGTGTPASVRAVLEEVCKEIDPSRLAGHVSTLYFMFLDKEPTMCNFCLRPEQFHDTNGTALANIFTALDMGLRSFDASVGGLGGCPYSPGATGNVATEDVVYALTGESFCGDIGEPYSGMATLPCTEYTLIRTLSPSSLTTAAVFPGSKMGRWCNISSVTCRNWCLDFRDPRKGEYKSGRACLPCAETSGTAAGRKGGSTCETLSL